MNADSIPAKTIGNWLILALAYVTMVGAAAFIVLLAWKNNSKDPGPAACERAGGTQVRGACISNDVVLHP